MTVERLFPLIVAVLYLITAISYASKNNAPLALLWLAYSVGNVAIVWACWNGGGDH